MADTTEGADMDDVTTQTDPRAAQCFDRAYRSLLSALVDLDELDTHGGDAELPRLIRSNLLTAIQGIAEGSGYAGAPVQAV